MKGGKMSHWSKQEDKRALEEKSELHQRLRFEKEFSVSPTRHCHKENSFRGWAVAHYCGGVVSFNGRLFVWITRKVQTQANTETQLCMVHSAQHAVRVICCIIYMPMLCFCCIPGIFVCTGNQICNWVIKHAQAFYPHLPEMKWKLINNKVKTPKSK